MLIRPPNLFTALADIFAGFAASASIEHTLGNGIFEFVQHEMPWDSLAALSLSTVCLYAGGVVLNDFFDASIDRLERPERPIPSGVIKPAEAGLFGALLLLTGVIAGFLSNTQSGMVALVIAILVVCYNKYSKHHGLAGPLNMGLCRGANLMLGVSIFPDNLATLAFLMIIPIIYIAAITMVSRGEVHGGNKSALTLAVALYILTMVMIASLGLVGVFSWWQSLPFLLLLIITVLPPLIKAWRNSLPQLIGRAVKFGVIGLIILDAAIAAGFAGWFFGLLLLILLPFSILLAKAFAVT